MSLQFWQCRSTLASQTACRDSCIKISNSSQPMIHKDDTTIMLRCWCTICSWILYCNFQSTRLYCVYRLERRKTIRKNISRLQSKHDTL
jgi:hypothetical protein